MLMEHEFNRGSADALKCYYLIFMQLTFRKERYGP